MRKKIKKTRKSKSNSWDKERIKDKIIEQVNDSPEPLRSYIHGLECGCSADVILQNENYRQYIDLLEAKLRMLFDGKEIRKKKIKKTRKSKFADRLKKAGEVKTIDETYVVSFGQLKNMKIREAIIADFKYVDWCVQEKIFKLNADLQRFFDNIVETQTFDKEEEEKEANDWAKMFD